MSIEYRLTINGEVKAVRSNPPTRCVKVDGTNYPPNSPNWSQVAVDEPAITIEQVRQWVVDEYMRRRSAIADDHIVEKAQMRTGILLNKLRRGQALSARQQAWMEANEPLGEWAMELMEFEEDLLQSVTVNTTRQEIADAAWPALTP